MVSVCEKTITILGATATGKTKFAVQLADEINAEIISADSRQVYCLMDIGTGKDLLDYKIDDKQISVHLIDIAQPGTEYNIFLYQQAAHQAITDIQMRNKKVIICGGSGMYIEALLKGYHLFPVPSILIGLTGERNLIRNRITKRLIERINSGMIEEVEQLINFGVKPEQLIRYGLEYRYITLYLLNQIDKETMFERLNIAIHQFSKRQMTWFRKMERSGFKIHWIDIEMDEQKRLDLALSIIHNYL